jgi:hypothetical protein
VSRLLLPRTPEMHPVLIGSYLPGAAAFWLS